MTILRGASVLTGSGWVDGGWVRTDGELVVEVGAGESPAVETVDLQGGLLVPGLVDLHCHGAAGVDFGSADAEQVARAAALHLRHGTTTLLASLVTAPVEQLCGQLAVLADVVEEGGTSVVGAHLEGPFLNAVRCGAQDARAMVAADVEVFHRLHEAARGSLRAITLAPELPGALAVIDAAVAAGVVVAVGHTDATYDQARAAFDRGATMVTHLFNAMRPLHHREPGPAGAALEAGVLCEVVNDGVHVHPAVVGLVPDEQLVLVTDAMSATGVGDGLFRLGPHEVQVHQGRATLVEGGAIAGSTLTMDRALHGLDRLRGLRGASTVPAGALGLADRGAVEPGRRVDLVHLVEEGPDLVVRRVWRGGEPVP